MDKKDVFKNLFSEGIVPELRHIVTAESLILYDCDVKKWNEIASIDMKEKLKVVNKFEKERKRLSKEEQDML